MNRSRCIVALWVIPFLATAWAQTPSDTDKDKAFRWLDEQAEPIRQLSLTLWKTPEVATQEVKSSRELIAYLETNGFHVERGVAGMPTAFVAAYGHGKPVIAFYGEYDALPGLSQHAVCQRSPVADGGPGHGCGHNLIGAGCAGAAVALSKLLQAGAINGTLRYYGTPAEENVGAKTFMLQAGLFNDVDALLGWHPHDVTWAGFQSCKAAISVHFSFKGVAAYAGNSPQLGRNALRAAELLEMGVNSIREQFKDDVRISSVLTTTATQPSVVTADAEVWYQIRANKYQDLPDVFGWVSDVAKGAALMTRTAVESRFDYDTHEFLPNRPLAELVDRNLRLVGPPQFADEDKSMAAKMQEPLHQKFALPLADSIGPLPESPKQGFFFTDAGAVSWKVPHQAFEVAAYPYGVPIHTWQVTASAGLPIGQKAMMVAAKTLAGSAIDLYKNPALLKAVQKDFKERRKEYDDRVIAPKRNPPTGL